MKKFKKFGHWLLVIGSCLYLGYWLLVIPTRAQHFESPSYIIDWGNFNITSGKKTSTNYFLTDTVGQNAPGLFTSSTYRVKSGFQYIYDLQNQFTFTIDNLNINLSTLVAGVASTAANILTITTPSGNGYQIMAGYSHPLSQRVGVTIPDTACDAGTPCTASSANIWTSGSRYGFGYNAAGVGTTGYFPLSTYYRPFSTDSQIIAAESTRVKDRVATVTYKALISAVQSAGSYQTSVIFTATPRY